MGSRAFRSTCFCLLLAAGILCAASLPAGAEDPPQEKPKQQTEKQQEATPPPGSLAAAAAGIKLQKADGDDSGSLVISDQNVKKAGKGAAVSEGSGSVAGSPAVPAPPGQQANAAASANAAADELQAQKVKVQNMEAQLAEYDKQLAAPPTDPKYPKYSNAPHSRSPGVIDPAQGQRDEYAKRLEEERAKLQELEKKANQAGVREAAPVPSAAQQQEK